MHAPDILTRIKFAPAGYVSAPGVTHAKLQDRVRADGERFALAFYQVADWRVSVRMTTSLRPGLPEIVSTESLAAFVRDAYAYLAAVGQQAPVRHRVSADDDLQKISTRYQISVIDLATHIAQDSRVLATGAELRIPLLHQVMPNSSIDEILDGPGVPENLTPGILGGLNRSVLLTPGVTVDVGGVLEPVRGGTSLESLAQGASELVTPGEIAHANRKVKALFLEGEILSFGVSLYRVGTLDTLASIAHRHEMMLEVLANANASTRFLAERAEVEIPLHRQIVSKSPCRIAVEDGESLLGLADRIGGAIRDVATANADTVDLLAITEPPHEILYQKQNAATPSTEPPRLFRQTVCPNDTLATITARLAHEIGEPSLKPADVAAYGPNAENKSLLQPEALLLKPPSRVVVPLSVPPDGTHTITIAPLEVKIDIVREDVSTVAPEFRASPDVNRVSTPVAPRLSSQFSRDNRGTLVEFARQFQTAFPHLRLATGPNTLQAIANDADDKFVQGDESHLIVVQWDPSVLHANVHGPACFFAPKPLLTRLWSAADVPIYDYVPGKPLVPEEAEAKPTLTKFTGVDLERWAERLLHRIDALLEPEMAIPLRELAAAKFQSLINSKQSIAIVVADRLTQVLHVDDKDAPQPDVQSARNTYLKQILVELGEIYRGAVVVQYEAEVIAPSGGAFSDPHRAPRFLCDVEQVATPIPADVPTLHGLAASLSAPTVTVGHVLASTENLLCVGETVPVGTQPKIEQQDTLRTIARKAAVDFDVLIETDEGQSRISSAGCQGSDRRTTP